MGGGDNRRKNEIYILQVKLPELHPIPNSKMPHYHLHPFYFSNSVAKQRPPTTLCIYNVIICPFFLQAKSNEFVISSETHKWFALVLSTKAARQQLRLSFAQWQYHSP